MSKWPEFHVAVSGAPIAVNPDNVCRIGEAVTLEGRSKDTSFIRQTDGSTVDVKEPYAIVKAMLEGKPMGTA